MRPATIAKFAAVALVATAGFVVGHSGSRSPNTEEQGLTPSGSDPLGSEDLETSPADPRVTGRSSTTASKRPSPLAETLKFERYLATCDIAMLRTLLEETYSERGGDYNRSSAITRAWRLRDPDGFMAWIPNQPALIQSTARSNHYSGVRDGFVIGIATDDPEAAWQLAEKMNSDDQTKWSILRSVLKRDPATALRLAEAHPEAYSQSNLLFRAYHSGVDPMQALTVMGALHPGGGRAALADDGSNYYANQLDKPDEASIWFQKLPPDAQRYVVVKLERGSHNSSNLGLVNDALPKLREIWKLPEE